MVAETFWIANSVARKARRQRALSRRALAYRAHRQFSISGMSLPWWLM